MGLVSTAFDAFSTIADSGLETCEGILWVCSGGLQGDMSACYVESLEYDVRRGDPSTLAAS